MPSAGSRGLPFSCRQGIWIPWSIITPWPEKDAIRTPIPRAAGFPDGRTGSHRLQQSDTKNVQKDADPSRGHRGVLRRLAHYDYWSDTVKRSVLLDARRRPSDVWDGRTLGAGNCGGAAGRHSVRDITYVRGTVFRCRSLTELSGEYEVLPSYGEIISSKEAYARSYYRQYENTDAITAKRLVEPYKRRNMWYRILRASARDRGDGCGL